MLNLASIDIGNFEAKAIEIFRYQYQSNAIYQSYCQSLKVKAGEVECLEEIPFLPIQFYKTHPVFCAEKLPDFYFESSGTSQSDITSKHYITHIQDYNESIELGFQYFFSDKKYTIIGLLPHYLERPNSSLVYMVKHWMKMNEQEEYFFLNDFESLNRLMQKLLKENKNILLIGLSSALLDFSKLFKIQNSEFTIIETGGMKGKYPEMLKSELFDTLKMSFPNARIISEYGMCELFSQAYSDTNAVFTCPPWMKLLVSDINDPLSTLSEGSGIAKIIDLANRQTCSFIETQDMIKLQSDGRFEILGRADSSDIRGCSLMYS